MYSKTCVCVCLCVCVCRGNKLEKLRFSFLLSKKTELHVLTKFSSLPPEIYRKFMNIFSKHCSTSSLSPPLSLIHTIVYIQLKVA